MSTATIGGYCKNHKKHTNTLGGQIVELSVFKYVVHTVTAEV